jgi:hypothetical protein
MKRALADDFAVCSTSARPHAATAFGHTFVWAVAIAVLAMVPAAALWRAGRASRAGAGTPVPAVAQVEASR